MSAARREPATAQVLGGRYRLEERIASGGMGTVWAAHDETLDRRVAVKVLNEGLSHDERFVERFRREALAAAGLAHPNIAGVFDYGEEEGRPYIVMELLHGETLAERLRQDGAMDPALVARIGTDVAGALADAHQHGLVHRDVKPANIMVTDRGDVKVMDFGIAASAAGGTGLTGTGMVMGTARYLSPEQASGGQATPASDLYSLGAVLYELLTGQPAFERPTPVATAMAHVHDPLQPVRALRPDAPPSLAGLIEACLAKDPAARPPSAAEVAAELRADAPLQPGDDTAVLPVAGTATLELPVAALPETPPETPPPGPGPSPVRGRDWRSPRVLIAAAVLAIVVAVALGIALGGSDLTVKVPAFRGKSRTQAALLAKRSGLHPVFRTRPASGRPGIVIRQRPTAGTEVTPGSDIVLVVSKGPGSTGTIAPSPSPQPSPAPNGHHGKPTPRHHKKPKPHGH